MKTIKFAALLALLSLLAACGVQADTAPASAENRPKLGAIAPPSGANFVHGAPSAVGFSTSLEASHVVKAAKGIFYSASIRLDSTAPSATYYVQVWDASSAPADTTAIAFANALCAPTKVIHTSGTDDIINIDLGAGVSAANGISIVLSTTEFTKTISGSYLSVTGLYL